MLSNREEAPVLRTSSHLPILAQKALNRERSPRRVSSATGPSSRPFPTRSPSISSPFSCLTSTTHHPNSPQQSQFPRKLYKRSFFLLKNPANLLYCQHVHIAANASRSLALQSRDSRHQRYNSTKNLQHFEPAPDNHRKYPAALPPLNPNNSPGIQSGRVPIKNACTEKSPSRNHPRSLDGLFFVPGNWLLLCAASEGPKAKGARPRPSTTTANQHHARSKTKRKTRPTSTPPRKGAPLSGRKYQKKSVTYGRPPPVGPRLSGVMPGAMPTRRRHPNTNDNRT